MLAVLLHVVASSGTIQKLKIKSHVPLPKQPHKLHSGSTFRQRISGTFVKSAFLPQFPAMI